MTIENKKGGSGTAFTTMLALVAVCATVAAVIGWSKVAHLGQALGKAHAMQAMKPPTPTVDVQTVYPSPVMEPESYIAKVESMESVEIEARVSGYIEKVHIEDGAFVKKGDLLFTLEKQQYEAEVNAKKAAINQAKADVIQFERYYSRLQKADSRSVSKSDLDTAESDVLVAKATLKQAEANLKLAEINLNYTKIYAPISGKVGKVLVTEGNLARTSDQVLVKIVQVSPVRVVFSTTDKEYIKAMRLQNIGQVTSLKSELLLADNSRYKHEGSWEFVNNEMDPKTGTIAIHAKFENSDNLLIPGGYVRILISPRDAQTFPTILQTGLLADKDGSFVLVLDDNNIAQRRPIKVYKRNDQVILASEGLKVGDKVVVSGLHKARVGAPVIPHLVNPKEQGK